MMDATTIRKDFPQFDRKISDKPIIYLDSTATSLKPRAVIQKIEDYYTKYTANIFRGIYKTSEEATKEYEDARGKVAAFIRAPRAEEIIFTRNASESINLVAYSWGKVNIQKGDEIVVTIMEHHSNFVPWQQLAIEKGAKLIVWKSDALGTLNLKDLDTIITRRTKLLAIASVSNFLGTINPIKEIIQKVKTIRPECVVLVDAAQSVPHMKTDVVDMGADFVVFSSHKMLGPTGIGVLWGRYELLDSMSPFQYGGDMIQEVRIEQTLFKAPPHKFEAGTPHIAGVIGLGAAVDYLATLGMDAVRQHEKEIVAYALTKLKEIPGLTIYGPTDPKLKGGVVAFTMKSAHAHDIAQILDEDNICIRSGNHCAMPLHIYMNISASARASFYVYTTKKDIDMFIQGLEKVNKIFK